MRFGIRLSINHAIAQLLRVQHVTTHPSMSEEDLFAMYEKFVNRITYSETGQLFAFDRYLRNYEKVDVANSNDLDLYDEVRRDLELRLNSRTVFAAAMKSATGESEQKIRERNKKFASAKIMPVSVFITTKFQRDYTR